VEALARQVEVGTFLLIVYFSPFCLAQPHLKFSRVVLLLKYNYRS
jgi:hypothetical protein